MQSLSKNWNSLPKHRIVVVDDHIIVRSMLRQLLESDFPSYTIEEAGSAEQLISLCKEPPHLVILDLSMPGMGGLEALRRLKRQWSKIKIIIFSTFHDSIHIEQALKCNADAYITKNSSIDIISEGINKVMNGISFLSPDITESLLDKSQKTAPNSLKELSTKQMVIFKKLAEGLNTKQISQDLFLSEKTIGNNATSIRKKLGVSSTAELVHIAIDKGLIETTKPIQ